MITLYFDGCQTINFNLLSFIAMVLIVIKERSQNIILVTTTLNWLWCYSIDGGWLF